MANTRGSRGCSRNRRQAPRCPVPGARGSRPPAGRGTPGDGASLGGCTHPRSRPAPCPVASDRLGVSTAPPRAARPSLTARWCGRHGEGDTSHGGRVRGQCRTTTFAAGIVTPRSRHVFPWSGETKRSAPLAAAIMSSGPCRWSTQSSRGRRRGRGTPAAATGAAAAGPAPAQARAPRRTGTASVELATVSQRAPSRAQPRPRPSQPVGRVARSSTTRGGARRRPHPTCGGIATEA